MSGATAAKVVDENGPTPIPISALSLQQLQSVKETLNIEIQALSKHVVDLRHATRRLEESKKALEDMGTSAEGAEVLLPITLSVFVPGQLVDTNNVLIDIGTGYLAERKIAEADKHFEARIQTISETCTKALRAISGKQKIAEAIAQQTQEKVTAISKTEQE